ALLSRFYDVQRGRVLVGGCDVRELPQAALRRAMGVVLQEPFLFAGPVIDNLTLSRPTVSRADAIAAAYFVQADTFIRRLPQGYDTPLGERGGALSTGQKQLLALARALAQNPEMLLVLDEATANVDSETEHLIHGALERLVRGRTSVIIAHRLSTIRHADRILVLRQGRQLALGTHSELLATCAYYRRLCEMLALNPA
ncbi:MAG: ATP-binding cassette domain-containing protein, partial [Candidatus Marinimicrobia bacterium]|nr:ATP-binding cassette domain-containing protein [Candidatus Neomarinimicrobiota bacterium]